MVECPVADQGGLNKIGFTVRRYTSITTRSSAYFDMNLELATVTTIYGDHRLKQGVSNKSQSKAEKLMDT